jgi:hypothetical protein
MSGKIEEVVLSLIPDKRFKILKDSRLHSDGGSYWESDGRDYDEHTELESNNLKILYVKSLALGSGHTDEITIMNKGENVDYICSSSDTYGLFKDKNIKKIYLGVDELKDYIDKNA